MSNEAFSERQLGVLRWLRDQEDNNPTASPKDLSTFETALFQRLESLEVQIPKQRADALTLFYSGKLGSTESWKVAEEIGRASQGHVVTIGDTELGHFLNDKAFGQALQEALDDRDELVKGIVSGIRPDGSTTPSIWDRASQRLAQAAQGDVRTLTQAAEDHKVFASKELPELLKNPKVTHINGVGIEAYRHIHANTPGSEVDKLRAVNQAVQHTSFEIARDVKLDHTDRLIGQSGQQRLAREVHRVDPGKVFDGTPYTTPPRLSPMEATIDLSKNGSIESRGLEHAQSARQGAQALAAVEHAAQTPHARLPPGSVLKGLGVAGTVYGVAQGINDTRGAVDQAYSNREQWVRGGEAGADVAARGTVTGAAATVGAIPGAAAGALTSPVTGPVGPIGGALATGGAAAYGADKAYEDSRLQALAKSFGRDVGALGYDYISREGRLLREVNGLKEDLQSEIDPSRRQALESRLSGANGRFGVEVERNGRYFEAKGDIENSWGKAHAQFPKLDKDDVNKALAAHIDAGKPATEAANAAYSDALHEKYPRARPHQPQENYRALSNEQLLEQHGTFTSKLVEDRREAMTQASTVDSRNSIDQGWPKALAQQRQAGRVEESLNAVWKDAGHVSAIRGAMQERGMKPPELPAALRERAVNSPEHGPDNANKPAATAPTNARDAFRTQENLDRRNEAAVSSDFSRATAATHQHQFKVAETALTPGLRSRGLDREEIERVSAATVSHTQQNAQRGGIQGIYLSTDGQRVAVRQDTPPIGEFNVSTALTQTGEQHLERAQLLAQAQARSQAQDAPDRDQTQPQTRSQLPTPAAPLTPTDAQPARAMA